MLASETIDLGRLLLDVMILLGAARVCGEVVERIGLPSVIGEIGAGLVVGPSVLNAVTLDGGRGVSLAVIAEIGVLLLLVIVGLETDLAELRRVGRSSIGVAIIGVVVPFAAGTGVALAFDRPQSEALFFGAALVATSVGITARVLGDAHALATREARIILGAAVADDVLGLIILTVVVALATGGSVSVGLVGSTVGLAFGFLVVGLVIAVVAIPRLIHFVHAHASSPSAVTAAAIVIMLALAQLAHVADLAFIIGAFMAGIGLGRTGQRERIEHDLSTISHVFVPAFFAHIGLNADLDAMINPSVMAIAGVTTVVAVGGKMVAAVGARGSGADALTIGIGMIPRGEVGLIFASIGLSNAILDERQYGAVLLIVLATTVIAPPLLRARLRHTATRVVRTGDQTGGRVAETAVTVDVVGRALAIAAHVDGPVDRQTAEWFGEHRGVPAVWRAEHTAALIDLLRAQRSHAWRFLDATGVLDRALPRVARALARRRADLTVLDSVGWRFDVVTALLDAANDPTAGDIDITDQLLLAAFAADICSDTANDAEIVDDVTGLMNELGQHADAARIASVVSDARLLLHRAYDRTGFSERERLQMSAHLADLHHAKLAGRLALALQPLDAAHREALHTIIWQVDDTLRDHHFADNEGPSLAESRRRSAQQLVQSALAYDRLAHAPTAFLLAHPVEALARQADVLEPAPPKGRARVRVSATDQRGRWRIDIACRDAPGLLARLSAALTQHGFNIASADVATWPDGAVLDTFVVTATGPGADEPPSEHALTDTVGRLLRHRNLPPVVTVATPSWDQRRSPWHTSCVVTAADQPGVLQSVASAFGRVKANVHSASVVTVDGQATIRLQVTDRHGNKLSPATRADIEAMLAPR